MLLLANIQGGYVKSWPEDFDGHCISHESIPRTGIFIKSQFLYGDINYFRIYSDIFTANIMLDGSF